MAGAESEFLDLLLKPLPHAQALTLGSGSLPTHPHFSSEPQLDHLPLSSTEHLVFCPQPQGSCQSELHRALERLAASQSRTHEDLFIIPIPNCDRNGNFHPKQVGLPSCCSALASAWGDS